MVANADGCSGTGTLSGVVENGLWCVCHGGGWLSIEYRVIELVPGGVG